jgi:hypothetical protein
MMRLFGRLFVLALPLLPVASAFSQSPAPASPAVQWRSKGVLDLAKSNKQACRSTMAGYYDFVLTGDRLSATSSAGSRTEAAVKPDGTVDHTFTSNLSGSSLHITGNARTKQLFISNDTFGCVYTQVPP